MSKLLEATCQSGIVKVGTIEVADTAILSEGVGASSGVLLLEQDGKTYIAKTSPDLKTALEKVASALGQIATALTTIDAKPVGGSGSAPAPAVASQITQITTLQSEITTLKGMLK